MRSIVRPILMLLPFLAPACSSDAKNPFIGACQDVCEVSEQTECGEGMGACTDRCRDRAEGLAEDCSSKYEDYLDCAKTVPVEKWVCAESNGRPVLREGACTTAKAAANECADPE